MITPFCVVSVSPSWSSGVKRAAISHAFLRVDHAGGHGSGRQIFGPSSAEGPESQPSLAMVKGSVRGGHILESNSQRAGTGISSGDESRCLWVAFDGYQAVGVSESAGSAEDPEPKKMDLVDGF